MDFTQIFDAITNVVGAVTVLLGALYALALVLPGEQPDKALKAAYEFTKRFSKK